MNKNRKYGTVICSLLREKKEKIPGCAPIMKKFLLLSVPEQRSKMFFPTLSFIYNWVKLSWHICATRVPFFLHTFWKHFLCGRAFTVHVRASTGPPTSAVGSQVLLTHLNEIHFDVTFERITSAWGSREEVSSLLRYWLKTTTAYLSFSDGRYTWPWVTIRHGEIPYPHAHPSLIPVLSVPSVSGRVAVLFLFYCTKLSTFPDTSSKWSSLSVWSQVR